MTGTQDMRKPPGGLAREVSCWELGSRRKERGGTGAPINPLSLSRKRQVGIGHLSRERGKANKPEGSLAFPY